jgi:PEGA domain
MGGWVRQMATEREDETPHVPLIVIRVQTSSPTEDEFVVQHCRYFGVDVVFLPTEGVQPPGRRVRFAFVLGSGQDVVTGEGVVLRMRRDSNSPQRPPGMELRYQCLDEPSQRVVDRMLLLRTQGVVVRKADPPPYVSMWLERDEHTQQTTTLKRRASVEPSMTLPANPFAEVPPQALSYFVDWAIERATDARRRGPSRTSFARVKMRPNRRDSPLRRARVVVAFSGGLATGLVLLLFGGGPPRRADAVMRANAAAVSNIDRSALATPAELAARSKPGVGGNAAAASSSQPLPAARPAVVQSALAGAPPPANPPAATASAELPATPNALSTLLAQQAYSAAAAQTAAPASPPAKPTLLASARPSLEATTSPPSEPVEATAEPAADSERDVLDPPAPPTRPIGKKSVPLFVTSTPPGWVEVDGRRRGRSPLTTVVEAGPHEVVIERPRYLSAHEHVDGPGRLAVELVRPPATLHVTSSPSGAAVRIDGHSAGSTPVNLTLPAYEQHKVEVELNGRTQRRKVYLRPPLASVDFELAAALPPSRSTRLGKRSEQSPPPNVLLASP